MHSPLAALTRITLGLALVATPLAAQTAMAIGYFQGGVVGATLIGLAFILPSYRSCCSDANIVMVAPGCWRGFGCCADTLQVSTALTDSTNTATGILAIIDLLLLHR